VESATTFRARRNFPLATAGQNPGGGRRVGGGGRTAVANLVVATLVSPTRTRRRINVSRCASMYSALTCIASIYIDATYVALMYVTLMCCTLLRCKLSHIT